MSGTGAEFPVRAVIDDKDIDRLIASITKAGKSAGLSEAQIKKLNDQVKRTGNEGPQEVNKFNNSLNNLVDNGVKKVFAIFATGIIVNKIREWGGAIIDITAEFQKFQAVLKVTLGSEGAADQAFRRIQKFAAETPFSVKELTESFVKLANRGFVPTNEELRKMGDLAASQGKSFDQLTEAVLDAQTLEFERLKEFGIKAKQTNDSVIFTFKGVKTQVNKNDEAIKQYILSLGDLKGVTGGMNEISKTLGGTLSNVGDSVDRLSSALGNQESGPLKKIISTFGTYLNQLAEYIEYANSNPFKTFYGAETQKAVEDFAKLTKTKQAQAINETVQQIQRWRNELEVLKNTMKNTWSQSDFEKAAEAIGLKSKDATEITKAYGFEIENTTAILADYEDRFKQFSDIYQKDTSKNTELTKEQLKALKELMEEQEALLKLEAYLKGRAQSIQLNNDAKAAFKETPLNIDINADKKLEGSIFKQVEKDKTQAAKDNAAMRDEIYNREFEKEVEREKQRQQIVQGAVSALMNIENTFASYKQAVSDNEIANLQKQHDYEISLAGDNEKAKSKIDRQYQTKLRVLKREQAIRDKNLTMFNIGIQGAEAFVEALPNYVLAALVAASTIAEELIVASKPLPAFARGVYKLKGPGTSTSDSITARLSKDESVVPADKSNKFGFFLEPLINGREAEAMAAMRMYLRNDMFTMPAASDNGIAHELREIKQAIENKKEWHWNITEEGLQVMARQGEEWTKYVNKRYSSKR